MRVRRLVAAATGMAVAAGAYALARQLPPSRRQRWERTNHAGDAVTLLEGPAHVAGLTVGALLGTGAPLSAGLAPALLATGAGALGALDDLYGDGSSKGFGGHLRAAARGVITTGLVKVVGLSLLGVAIAATDDLRLRRSHGREGVAEPGDARSRPVDALVGGAVIAGAANLVNLFDLRPGRALKVGVLLGAPLVVGGAAGSPLAAAAIGACAGSLPPDLAGQAMLGDTGANALGAVLGLATIRSTGRPGRLVVLAAIVAVTLASERVSFTAVIERTPVLAALDAWGRRRA